MHLTESAIVHEEHMQAKNERIKSVLKRLAVNSGRSATIIDGLTLTRWNIPDMVDTCFYAPSIGLIVQGRKESIIGRERFVYGELDCLVNGVDMPSKSRVLGASPDQPLLAVSLAIDTGLAHEIALETSSVPSVSAERRAAHPFGVSVARVMPDVLDAFTRLVELLEKPDAAALLGPLTVREIIFRVFMGPQGDTLRMIHAADSPDSRIARAITWLREHYRQPLHVEALAASVQMATSTFHHQFKRITSLSPLQFQKQLRLHEAQRLMLVEHMDAGTAGRTVGYESASQFSREYKRIFGEPPYRSLSRLRNGE